MLVVPLEACGVDVETVGGKARSLSRLLAAGFDVPSSFVVASTAYRRFVADNGLEARILDLARPAAVDGTASFDAASAAIQSLFAAHSLADDLIAEIGKAYGELGAEISGRALIGECGGSCRSIVRRAARELPEHSWGESCGGRGQ